MRFVICTLWAILGLTVGGSYNGFKVYKVVAKNEAENTFLESLESHRDFDFWSNINKVGNPVRVMVAPQAQNLFELILKGLKADFSIEIEDVESTIQAETKYHESKAALRSGEITFDRYLRLSEINAYLAQMAQKYPEIATVKTIGQSYEKRDMNIIRISSGTTDPPKPIIFVEAGIHGREWIAPAVALYLIHQLVENPNNTNLIQNLDWIILPSANPDGYEYSWTKERLRRTTLSSVCGCDANRNFDFHWKEFRDSPHSSIETYPGPSAFSEVEARNLRDFILKTANIKAYLSLHSYGQYVLYPWGWTSDVPKNSEELHDLGTAVSNAIKAFNGTSYSVGTPNDLLYPAFGVSTDWAMGVAGINLVYTIELPRGGMKGFDLPADRIDPVVKETFEGLKVYGNYILKPVK